MLPADRAPAILAVTASFFILATIAVALRIYARRVLLNTFGIDDYMMLLAHVCFTGAAVMIFVGRNVGVGKHRDVVSVAHYEVGMELWYFTEMVYGATILFTKLSVALYLKRIAAAKIHLLAINIAVGASTIFSVFFLFYLMFQCQPINYYWTRYGDGVGSCRNPYQTGAAIYAFSGVNGVIDLVVATVPWLIVKDLQMDIRTKISVCCVLMLGSMTGIATIIRIPYLHNLSHPDDFLWSTSDVTIWSSVEMGLGITAASMATLKPIFKRFRQWTSTYSHSRSKFTDLEGQGDKSTLKRVSNRLGVPKRLSRDLFGKSKTDGQTTIVELDDFTRGTTLTTVVGGTNNFSKTPETNVRGNSSDGSEEWNRYPETSTKVEQIDVFSTYPDGNSGGITKSTKVEIDVTKQSIGEALYLPEVRS